MTSLSLKGEINRIERFSLSSRSVRLRVVIGHAELNEFDVVGGQLLYLGHGLAFAEPGTTSRSHARREVALRAQRRGHGQPADAVITAPSGSARWAASTAASAPRTLKLPVTWRLSIFTKTGRPRSEMVIVGVGCKYLEMISRACSSCSFVGGGTLTKSSGAAYCRSFLTLLLSSNLAECRAFS